jgi:hypothetical protein
MAQQVYLYQKDIDWIIGDDEFTAEPEIMEKKFVESPFKITVPIGRYQDAEETLVFEGKDFTVYDVLCKINSFYHLLVTQKLLDKINSEHDTFDYKKRCQANLGKTEIIDLMGDLKFFEGFVKLNDNHYWLSLGS